MAMKVLIGTPIAGDEGLPAISPALHEHVARCLLRALWWREKLRMWLPYAGRGREQSVVWEAPEVKS